MEEERDISLRQVLTVLWQKKLFITTITSFFTVCGILYAVFTLPLYTATTVVIPISEQETGGLAELASKYAGAAAIAGISLQGGTSKEEYLAILRSRQLTRLFIKQNDILPDLFPERWNAEKGQWAKRGDGIVRKLGISSLLANLSGDEGWKAELPAKPTDWEANKRFNEETRSIVEDLQTGIVSVSFTFRNPETAAKWANSYIALANNVIRDDVQNESKKALEYLEQEVKKTNISDLREKIYSLIEHQLERITFANTREEYAFRIIDKAIVPEERSYPKRFLIVFLSIFVGFIISSSISLFLNNTHTHNTKSKYQ